MSLTDCEKTEKQLLTEHVKSEMQQNEETFNELVGKYRTGALTICKDCVVIHTFDGMTAEECKGAAKMLMFFLFESEQDTETAASISAHVHHAAYCYVRETETLGAQLITTEQ